MYERKMSDDVSVVSTRACLSTSNEGAVSSKLKILNANQRLTKHASRPEIVLGGNPFNKREYCDAISSSFNR